MHTIYRLNANELDQDFLDGLKATFKDKEIEIIIYEIEETAYLLSSSVNGEKLLKAVNNVKNKSDLIEVHLEECSEKLSLKPQLLKIFRNGLK